MSLKLPPRSGLSLPYVASVPNEWDAEWFRRFITNYLQNADVRNATSGPGISVSGTVGQPGTISLSTAFSNLFNEPYLLAETPTDASLTQWRNLTVQPGVLSFTDGGAANPFTVSVVNNGIGNTQLRQGGALTVIGNATGATANVADITITALTALLTQFGAANKGVVPQTGGVGATYYLNASGAWTIPAGSGGGGTTYAIGMDGMDGEDAVFGPPGSPGPQLANTPVTAAYATPLVVAAAYYVVYRCVLTGDVTIGLPTGGTDGNSVTFWLTASGAVRNVSLNAAIVIPSSSTFTSPQAIASGAKASIMLQYDATRGKWELVSFINGY